MAAASSQRAVARMEMGRTRARSAAAMREPSQASIATYGNTTSIREKAGFLVIRKLIGSTWRMVFHAARVNDWRGTARRHSLQPHHATNATQITMTMRAEK